MVFFSIVYQNHRNKCDGMCWFFLLLFHFMLNHIAMYQFTESIESDFFPSFWSCGLFTTLNRSNKRALSSENSSVVNSRAQKHLNPEKKILLWFIKMQTFSCDDWVHGNPNWKLMMFRWNLYQCETYLRKPYHTSNDKVKNQLNYASLTHKNDNNSSNSSGGINFPKQSKVTSVGAKMKVNL